MSCEPCNSTGSNGRLAIPMTMSSRIAPNARQQAFRPQTWDRWPTLRSFRLPSRTTSGRRIHSACLLSLSAMSFGYTHRVVPPVSRPSSATRKMTSIRGRRLSRAQFAQAAAAPTTRFMSPTATACSPVASGRITGRKSSAQWLFRCQVARRRNRCS